MYQTGLEPDDFEARSRALKERVHEIARRVAKAADFGGELKTGTIVRLKSGSPPMTIARFDLTDGLVYCQWVACGRPYAARYWPEMLEPAASGYLEIPPRKKPRFAHGANGPEQEIDAAYDEDRTGRALSRQGRGEEPRRQRRAKRLPNHSRLPRISETRTASRRSRIRRMRQNIESARPNRWRRIRVPRQNFKRAPVNRTRLNRLPR